jgi:hypothetical protein
MEVMIRPYTFCAALLVGMLICLEIGRYLGNRSLKVNPAGLTSGYSTVGGAIFGLYGLLLAFTFSGAPARYDVSRRLVQDEANAIGTAYLRLDLLDSDDQPALREQFREYVDSRLEVYRRLPNIKAAEQELSKSNAIQLEIWRKVVEAGKTTKPGAHPEATKLLIPALNEMIDIAGTRTMSVKIHPPLIIFGLLFLLALVCSVLAGFGMAGNSYRSWVHIITFTFVTVISIYAILQVEYPRLGHTELAAYDEVLVQVRQSMK